MPAVGNQVIGDRANVGQILVTNQGTEREKMAEVRVIARAEARERKADATSFGLNWMPSILPMSSLAGRRPALSAWRNEAHACA